jgi:hypothetical protein
MLDFDSGQATHNTLKSVVSIESDLGFGADEVLPSLGDSGGPMFIGQAIAGVHAYGRNLSAVDPTYNSNWGELNFETRVSYFRGFLEMATGGTVVFVPEPASVALIFTAAMGVFMRRYRSGP